MHLRLRSRFVSIDAARRDAILQEIDQNAALGQNFLVLVLLSCVIATFGLIQNSAAVIIGAMLVAPLMGPIVAFALALVYGDPRRVARALGTLALGAAIAVALSALLGLLVTLIGTVDFGATGLPSEILGRTQPSLFDLAVALAGGTAGSYALVQPRLSSALAGVAIATALMPPLCVVGLGISQGNMAIWGGALLLFLTNIAAIVFAASGIFALAGFLPAAVGSRRWRLPHARLVNLLLLLPVVVLLTVFTINITQQTQLTAAIRVTLTRELQRHRNTSLVHVDRSTDGGTLNIVATIRSPATLTLSEAQSIEAALAARLRQRVALNLLVVPVTSLDPLNPPTFTATSTPTPIPPPSRIASALTSAQATGKVLFHGTGTPVPLLPASPTESIGKPSPRPTSSGSVTPSPRPTVRATATATRTSSPTSTAIPTATPTVSRTPTPRPSATPTVSATPTPRPSATATWTLRPSATSTRAPRPTPTRTPVPTATPSAYAVVGGTGGLGVYAQRSPGLTAIVAALPDGTLVQLTGRGVSRDGYRWQQVVLPDGRVVWVPRQFLVPYRTYIRPSP